MNSLYDKNSEEFWRSEESAYKASNSDIMLNEGEAHILCYEIKYALWSKQPRLQGIFCL